MSVEHLAVVLHHSRARGTTKLVLVGIANHAGDGGAWPTVATLARYANVHPRKVQEHIARLREMGELEVDTQAGGLPHARDHERPNLYRVLVRCPPECDGTPQHRVDMSRIDRVPIPAPPAESGTPPGAESGTHNHPGNSADPDSLSTTDRARDDFRAARARLRKG